MNLQLHIKRFLEDSKTQYPNWQYNDFKNIFKLYTRFLDRLGITELDIVPQIVEDYLLALYKRSCHHVLTIQNHRRALNHLYQALKGKQVIKINPVPAFFHEPVLILKDRSYTDEEIIKSFTEDFRRLDYSPLAYPELEKILRRMTAWLETNKKRLQTMGPLDILQYAEDLDHYRKSNGGNLRYEVKLLYFQYIKWIQKWMYRNGYRGDDPTLEIKYTFGREQIEPYSKPESVQWAPLMGKYFQDQKGKWRPATFKRCEAPLRELFLFLDEKEIEDPHEITIQALEAYRDTIYAKEHFAETTKWLHLMTIRGFMNWLEKTNQILVNPIRKMSFPKKASGLPTRLMSPHEVKAYMMAAVPDSEIGLRNRAIFELMYSTGLRAGEVSGVRLEDIDFENGFIRVELPKGGPDYQRVVPIGQIALNWIKRYIDEGRNIEMARGRLFLTKKGDPIGSHIINNAMRDYAFKAGMRKSYSSHSWRVTCATMMLRNHADIRHIQEQLGHRSLESTKIYTRLIPSDLKKVHQKTHPREREYRQNQKNLSKPPVTI